MVDHPDGGRKIHKFAIPRVGGMAIALSYVGCFFVVPLLSKNPFEDHLRYQDELIVLAATGGKLTALAESGTGTLAAGAHQQAFDDITEAEAALISEVFQEQFDRPLLARMFPGQPQLA